MPAAVARRLNRIAGIAERHYNRETSGVVVHTDLRQIAGDLGLRAAARSGNVATLRAYVQGRFPAWYHLHVSRVQILRGARMIVDLGVPFVVNGPQARLPGGDTLCGDSCGGGGRVQRSGPCGAGFEHRCCAGVIRARDVQVACESRP